MAAEAAKLLDELMGRNRNAAPTENRRDIRWDDPEVCKFFLCDFCPHDLFVNTRADLGTCEKIHDDDLKQAYLKSSRCGKMGYDDDYLRFLQDLLADVERRIKKGQTRLHLNNSQAGLSGGPQVEREEKIEMLTHRINELVQQAEELGCEGNVEQAQGVLKLCEKLKEERMQLENSSINLLSQPKEMEVCNVCGAFLVVNDAQQRVDEHLMGKQHMGYAKLRVTVDTLKKKLCGETDAEREERLNRERAERLKEREERIAKEKEREQEREKEREERRRKRKEEEEARRKKRSRSRSRSRRSRSRDRKRRSRSRDRRSRSRDRHSRHRSRDRHRSKHSRRSRSRDKRSSRDDRRSRDRDRRSRDKKSSRDRDRRSRDRSSKDRSSKDRSSKDESNKDASTIEKPSEDATQVEKMEEETQNQPENTGEEHSSNQNHAEQDSGELESARNGEVAEAEAEPSPDTQE